MRLVPQKLRLQVLDLASSRRHIEEHLHLPQSLSHSPFCSGEKISTFRPQTRGVVWGDDGGKVDLLHLEISMLFFNLSINTQGARRIFPSKEDLGPPETVTCDYSIL